MQNMIWTQFLFSVEDSVFLSRYFLYVSVSCFVKRRFMITLHDENEKTSWQPKYGYRLPFLIGRYGGPARESREGREKKGVV